MKKFQSKSALEGRAPPVNFIVNGHQYNKGYYLTDGIYPKWAMFIQSVTCPQARNDKLFAEYQEAARKDVERAFGVLQSRFAIIQRPSLAWTEDILNDIMLSCIIMHNMIVEDERETYAHNTDTTEFNRSTQCDDEPFQYHNGRVVDINIYLKNKDEVEDHQHTHLSLKNDLVTNIWQKFGFLMKKWKLYMLKPTLICRYFAGRCSTVDCRIDDGIIHVGLMTENQLHVDGITRRNVDGKFLPSGKFPTSSFLKES
ncbi:hypothetical protein QQ045_010346 [Rhodiola kirilowii]